MNIDYDSRAIIINGEDVAKDANLLVVDRYGNVKDALRDDDILYPVAQIIPGQLREEDSTTITDIKNMLKAVELDDLAVNNSAFRSATVWSDDKTEILNVLVDGMGVFKCKKNGGLVKSYDSSMLVSSSNTTFGSNHTMKIYQGFLLGLNANMAEVYIKTDKLEINHCIIPSEGYRYPSICTEFFELIDHSKNSLHGSFVHKWGLEDSPVSFFDIEMLKCIFTRTHSYLSNFDDETCEIPESITEVFETDINLPLRRKLIAWYYFIVKHTSGNVYIGKCFSDFLESYFKRPAASFPDMDYVLDIIKKYI